MKMQKVNNYELKGTHKEIGRQLAKRMGADRFYGPAPVFFTDKETAEAMSLYDQYCPGIKEELEGFAEEAKIEVKDIVYTWMSYLIPRCSGLGVLGSRMADGHTRLTRNYEFSIGEEDLITSRISAEGNYTHIGGSIVGFGRTEGINECGLAVSMSSCGMPVSNIPGMKAPKIKGLQFWAVIRSLLDHCKDVDEALKLALEMPIAFNINLYLADALGNAVLLETIDGHKAYRQISEASDEKYICGTNHIILPKIQKYEPAAMRNSLVRYERLQHFMSGQDAIQEEQIRKLLLGKYPDGMSSYYYNEWFGTIKSVVMDTVERRYSICWFGQQENGWEDYNVMEPVKEKEQEKVIKMEQGYPEFFEFIPIAREESSPIIK